MPHTTRLLFMAGSSRSGSLNGKLARLGAEIADANGIPSALCDLGDYPMPIYDGELEARDGVPENAVKLKALMAVHAGIMIASPEYNAGITPLLKNTIDWVSRVKPSEDAPIDVFKTRVFALCSASPGGYGGMRGLMMLRQTLSLGLGAIVLPDQVAVARATDAFDEHGHLKDKTTQELLKSTIVKLARAARLLKGD